MVRITRLALGAAAVGGVLVAASAALSAHHSFAAEFDARRFVKLTGTVTKAEWINPHVWIHIDVVRPDGKVESWAIEGGAPANLFRRGLRKTSLQPGTKIIVEGYGAKDGSNRANGRDMTLADGRKLFVGGDSTGAPYDAQKR